MERLIHVIEINGQNIERIRTFRPEEVKVAHDLFKMIVRKNYTELEISDERIEEILETTKIMFVGDYFVQIFTGTWVN